jgi:hypothetical protein
MTLTEGAFTVPADRLPSRWREIDPDYAVGSFTAKLHGWAHTRRFIVVR